jgi:hypothetical protein
MISFPIYRKYSNNKNYFCILSDKEMLEIQQIGKRFIEHHLIAEAYPERVQIRDLIEKSHEGVEDSTKDEFEQIKKLV